MNGETRVLDVRAEAFIKRFSEHVIPIDCNEFDMEGIDEDLRNYFAVLVAGVVLRSYAVEIAYYRGSALRPPLHVVHGVLRSKTFDLQRDTVGSASAVSPIS